jgi:hypothetical protein
LWADLGNGNKYHLSLARQKMHVFVLCQCFHSVRIWKSELSLGFALSVLLWPVVASSWGEISPSLLLLLLLLKAKCSEKSSLSEVSVYPKSESFIIYDIVHCERHFDWGE